jgi:hypothetical protein
MSDRQLVRKMLEELDNYEGDFDEDYTRNTLRKMREPKDKLGGNKKKRIKPEWKRIEDKDED